MAADKFLALQNSLGPYVEYVTDHSKDHRLHVAMSKLMTLIPMWKSHLAHSTNNTQRRLLFINTFDTVNSLIANTPKKISANDIDMIINTVDDLPLDQLSTTELTTANAVYTSCSATYILLKYILLIILVIVIIMFINKHLNGSYNIDIINNGSTA